MLTTIKKTRNLKKSFIKATHRLSIASENMTGFQESDQICPEIPRWADSLMQLGYQMPCRPGHGRKIILVSMPCQSAGAGLVALGAMIKDFGREGADNENLHKDSLLSYAREFLSQGQHAEQPLDGIIREVNRKPTGRPIIHTVSDRTNFETGELAVIRNGVTTFPNPKGLGSFYIDGDPPLQVPETGATLEENHYEGLIPGGSILPKNLSRSYSGIVLAGRDNESCKKICSGVSFKRGNHSRTLAQLLTIQGWSEEKVSRVVFRNGRTEKIDRVSNIQPRLVVADSDTSLLEVIDSKQFRSSDIIGIMDRCFMDRERIERIREKTASLEQWYSIDRSFIATIPDIPHGISITALTK